MPAHRHERSAVAARPSGLADEHVVFHIQVRNLANDTPEQKLAAVKRETDVLRAVGGVAAVANVSQMPMSRSGSNTSLSLDRARSPERPGSTYISGDSLVKTFGLKLVEGRDFLPPEFIDVNETSEDVYPQGVIITRPLADKLWPGASAIGKTMYFGLAAMPIDPHHRRGRKPVSAHAETTERGMQSVIMPLRLYGGGRGTIYAVRTEPGQRERVMKEAEAALRKSSPTPMILELTSTDEDRKNRYRGDVALSWMLITVSVLLLLITAAASSAWPACGSPSAASRSACAVPSARAASTSCATSSPRTS
jgi:putative ABC transport system permease protein